jgi:23S rRNA (guanine745-N1)-methyltransferase
MTAILQCPVCKAPLLLSAEGFRCPKNHTFDASREGYVNLLLANKKHSKEPGDSREMIQGRRRFLDLGLYKGISDGINEAASGVFPGPGPDRAIRILDAGCGEGYYLKRLKEHLAGHGGTVPARYYGVDISKYAVRQAAKRDRTIDWFVASIADLPFLPSSLDLVLSVFSPVILPEFARVLGDGGALVTVTPGPKHLNGLREIVYPNAREHAQSAAVEEAGKIFSLLAETRVTYPLELTTGGSIMDLLAMTPYFWKIDIETKARVQALDLLTLDVDVEIRTFVKKSR